MTDFASPLFNLNNSVIFEECYLPYIAVWQAIIGSLWRGVLDGWKSLMYWSLDIRCLRWLWDWRDDEPVLRRSLIVATGGLLTWPLWLWLPWEWAAIGSVAALLYYIMGHRVDSWTVWVRYLGIGAVGYWAARKWWPREWVYGDFIDGWMRVGALWVGGVGWGVVLMVGWMLRG